uniref:Phosphatidylethanolamine-binding protein n=1 Tax=Glossina austeni TaxID=7395 RepID=A0A1A9VMF7_GLOAU
MFSTCARWIRKSSPAVLNYSTLSTAQSGRLTLSKLSRNFSLSAVENFHISRSDFISPSSSRCFTPVLIHQRNFAKMAKMASFEKNGIIPDVIDKVPGELMNVCYGGNVQAKEGNVLTPTQVKDQPELSWNAEDESFYTICMTDPDAPSRVDPKFREWHHWLVVNVPGCKLQSGDVLSAYIGSGPPKDTGLHRYVFLVYKQKCKREFDETRLKNNSADGRGGFKIASFAKKYELGTPVAGNFFQAEYDDYVPKLYEKLGVKTEPPKDPKAKGAKEAEKPKDTKAEASKEAKPDAAKDAKPDAAKDAKPEAAKEDKPEAAKEDKPEAAKEATPAAAKEATPEAAKEATPEAAKEAAPEAPKEQEQKAAAQ